MTESKALHKIISHFARKTHTISNKKCKNGEAIDEKNCVLDVLVTLNNRERLNIELQVTRQEFWIRRSLLYWCRTYDKLKRGGYYGDLMPAYHIGILDFTLFPESPEFFAEYRILNVKTGQAYSKDLCIRILDLTQMEKADHTPKECELLAWARVFKATTLDEFEKLAEGREVFQKMVEVVKRLGNDEQVRRQCEAREMYEWSMQAQYHGGFQKGRETGRTEGEETLGKLISVLVDDNRYEDVKRAAEDAEYRKQLYKEYHI